MDPRTSLLTGLLVVAPLALEAAPARRDIEINGPALNGTDLGRPRTLAVVSLKGGVLMADGALLKGVVVAGGALRVPGGASLLGARLEGLASDGKPVRVRVDGLGVAADPRPATPLNENADLALYLLSYQDGAFEGKGAARAFRPTGEFRPVCPGGERALALAGRWDYHLGQRGDSGRRSSDETEVTFACQGGALAKCVERMGYRPWRKEGGQPLAPLHESCVRAIRADYCGDGASLTRPGQQVNLYDAVGLQRDTEAWVPEAAWTPQGAACVSSTRLLDHPTEQGATVRGAVVRGCGARWSARPCAAPAAPLAASKGGPLLWTEHPPR